MDPSGAVDCLVCMKAAPAGKSLCEACTKKVRGEVNRYQPVWVIGSGGMGTVYGAWDPVLQRQVALKLLHRTPETSNGWKRFEREARAMALLKHPNIVSILDADFSGPQAYLVMPLVSGGSLSGLVNPADPVPPRFAAELCRTLALALAHAHSKGIVHRDVKPSNVLLPSLYHPLLTDFGLVHEMNSGESRISKPGHYLGTPRYWSPEQAAGKVGEVGPASDIYSLGATLFALLVGRPPFQTTGVLDDIVATLHREPESPSTLRQGVDEALDEICMRCLEKEPADRYASAQELAEDLQSYLDHTKEPPVRRTGSGRWLSAVGAALALLGVGWLPLAGLEGPDPGEQSEALDPGGDEEETLVGAQRLDARSLGELQGAARDERGQGRDAEASG